MQVTRCQLLVARLPIVCMSCNWQQANAVQITPKTTTIYQSTNRAQLTSQFSVNDISLFHKIYNNNNNKISIEIVASKIAFNYSASTRTQSQNFTYNDMIGPRLLTASVLRLHATWVGKRANSKIRFLWQPAVVLIINFISSANNGYKYTYIYTYTHIQLWRDACCETPKILLFFGCIIFCLLSAFFPLVWLEPKAKICQHPFKYTLHHNVIYQ